MTYAIIYVCSIFLSDVSIPFLNSLIKCIIDSKYVLWVQLLLHALVDQLVHFKVVKGLLHKALAKFANSVVMRDAATVSQDFISDS